MANGSFPGGIVSRRRVGALYGGGEPTAGTEFQKAGRLEKLQESEYVEDISSSGTSNAGVGFQINHKKRTRTWIKADDEPEFGTEYEYHAIHKQVLRRERQMALRT